MRPPVVMVATNMPILEMIQKIPLTLVVVVTDFQIIKRDVVSLWNHPCKSHLSLHRLILQLPPVNNVETALVITPIQILLSKVVTAAVVAVMVDEIH